MNKVVLYGAMAALVLPAFIVGSVVPQVSVQDNRPKIKAAAVKIAQARVNVVKADLKSAEMALKDRKDELDRARIMVNAKAIAYLEYLSVKDKYYHALGNYERDKARLIEAEALLEYAELTGEVDKALTFRAD